MRKAGLLSVLALAALLALAGPAPAQTAPGDDLTYTIPTDGLFTAPGKASWLHDYIGLWWLIPMIAVAALILWVARWINDDAHRHGINPVPWNYGTIILGLAALIAFVVVPPWLSLPLTLLALYLVLAKYIPLRNLKVLPTRRLFTPEHLHALKLRALGVLGIKEPGTEKKLAKLALTHLPVALFSESGQVMSPAEAPPVEEDPATSVKEIVGQALKRHARQVDIAPAGSALTATYVIDGMAWSGPSFERLRGAALMHMVKKLVKPDSASPQFRVHLPTEKTFGTFEASFFGAGDNEWLRLRVHPDGEEMRKLAGLGLTETQSTAVRTALEQGKGLIAVASPPGMGARTTIAAMLDSLDPFSRSITTYERPIAGRLASIEQHDLAGLSEPLSEALAEQVRKDYDVFMLSEVPDRATAEIALGALEREQLFIARFELADSASVVERLLAMGVDPALLARGLHTIVSQRLVRVLCAHCRAKVEPPVHVLQKAGIDLARVNDVWEESAGCDACGATGFNGRIGIFEVWRPSAASRQLIAKKADVHELRAAALHDRMTSLQHSGLERMLEGVTSLRELARALKVGQEGS